MSLTKIKAIEALIEERESDLSNIVGFLKGATWMAPRWDFDEEEAELLAPTILDLMKTPRVTRRQRAFYWFRNNLWLPITAVVLIAVPVTIYNGYQWYYAGYYPHTEETSRSARFPLSSRDANPCLVGSICVTSQLVEPSNDALNELQDGQVTTFANGKGEIVTVRRDGRRFTATVTKQ